MGTNKLKIASFFIFITLFLHSPISRGDAGDYAKDWVRANAHSLSERLCKITISSTLNNLFLGYHHQLFETQQNLRTLKVNTTSLQEQFLRLSLKNATYADLFNLLETLKDLLPLYDQVYVQHQKVLSISGKFKKLENGFTELSKKESVTTLVQRPILDPHQLINDVDLMDGINGVASTNPVEMLIKGGKAFIESAFNFRKNKKTNKKLQEARDLLNSLQISDAEFKEMLWQGFLENKDSYSQDIQTIRIAIGKTEKNTQDFLNNILVRFSYLDNYREALIKKHHDDDLQISLSVLKQKWHIQDALLFKKDLESKISILKFKLKTHPENEAEKNQLSASIKILEENLKVYDKILGINP